MNKGDLWNFKWHLRTQFSWGVVEHLQCLRQKEAFSYKVHTLLSVCPPETQLNKKKKITFHTTSPDINGMFTSKFSQDGSNSNSKPKQYLFWADKSCASQISHLQQHCTVFTIDQQLKFIFPKFIWSWIPLCHILYCVVSVLLPHQEGIFL